MVLYEFEDLEEESKKTEIIKSREPKQKMSLARKTGIITAGFIIVMILFGGYLITKRYLYEGFNLLPASKQEEEFLKKGISMPYYNQGDSSWGDMPYGDSTIYRSGCGITSCCMVIDGLTGLNLLPQDMAKWSSSHGFYVQGIGTAWALFPAAGEEYGLIVKNLSRNNPDEILNELKNGHPVIASLDKGSISIGAHIIVLRGISESGKIYINDPYSRKNSLKEWDFDTILNESSHISPECFWSFSKK